MWFSKGSRQSASTFLRVLKLPLYDGGCSEAARGCLALGDVEGAIAEWRRLADLGSGRARCVLAYVALVGTSARAPDLEEARSLATSALSGERGYASYVLGCISLKENERATAAKRYLESHKAGFVPATTLLASLLMGSNTVGSNKSSEQMLRRAFAAGHRPAALILSRFYLSGRLGVIKRLLGICLFPIAALSILASIRYHMFSWTYFLYSRSTTMPVFATTPAAFERRAGGLYLNALRLTHLAGAAICAAALMSQAGWQNAGAIVLAAWPYGLSYVFASSNNARSLVGMLVQTLLLCVITAFVCSAYLGDLLDFHLSGWMIAVITPVQAFLLVLACGLAGAAAKQAGPTDERIPSYRNPILVALMVLGLIAAGSVFARPDHWRVDYLHRYGFNVVGEVLLSFLPYLAVSLFLWRFPTSDRWKPWIFLGFIVIGTVLAVINNCGLGAVQPGYLSVEFFVWWQFAGFVAAAGWASDRYDW